MEPIDLISIINGCIKKDRKSQMQLYNWGFPILMREAYKYKLNKEDAKSLVNTAFLKIFDNLEKYNREKSFEYWCKRIMINTIIDDYRTNKKYNDNIEVYEDIGLVEEIRDFTQDEWNLVEQIFKESPLEEVLKKIDEKYRTVLLLHDVEGYNHEEIAEKLSISRRTSIRYLLKAREEIIKLIKQKKNMIFNEPVEENNR
jgi:RNA polymerase sigma-70 factor (ECF subfamily)